MIDINATLIAQVLNFLFLVFILAKFAYKPIINMMDERKNKIASDLENAELAKAEAEKLKAEYAAQLATVKAEYAAQLATVRQEAQSIIDSARKTAQSVHDKIIAETKAEQEQIVASAKDAIALEKQQALGEVRAQVIKLSLVAAGKILEQKLNSAEDEKLAGSVVEIKFCRR